MKYAPGVYLVLNANQLTQTESPFACRNYVDMPKKQADKRTLYVSKIRWREGKAMPEHVPFTCSCAHELFMKAPGTMDGGKARGSIGDWHGNDGARARFGEPLSDWWLDMSGRG